MSAVHSVHSGHQVNIPIKFRTMKPLRFGEAPTDPPADRPGISKSPNVNLPDAAHPPELHSRLPGQPMNIRVATVCVAHSTRKSAMKSDKAHTTRRISDAVPRQAGRGG